MKRPSPLVFLLVCTILSISWADGNDPAAAQRIWYVDDDAPGPVHDGTGWDTAFVYLQDALAVARPDQTIRVAQGIYKPDLGANQTAGSREATFQLISGVTLAGGYAGPGVLDPNGAPMDPNTRNIDLFKTILSGDLNGDDAEVADPCDLLHEATRAENSYHVVTSNETDDTTMLDGFTITGGQADGPWFHVYDYGGGMYNYNSNPTVMNCSFTANSSTCGGGIYNSDSNPVIINCTFISNAAGRGAGINNSKSNPTVTYCTFSRNFAKFSAGMESWYSSPAVSNCIFSENKAESGPGGMWNLHCSSSIITNCIFSGNEAGSKTGGLRNIDSSSTITNCIFIDNKAPWAAGFEDEVSSSTITNCSFIGNKADNRGGGIYTGIYQPYINCHTVVVNCILWGNEPDQIYNSSSTSTLELTYSNVQGGWGGPGNINSDPRFVSGPLGDYYLSQRAAGQWWDSPCVDAGNDTASNLDLDTRTTRTDEVGDQGRVDMGYHYPPWAPSGVEHDRSGEGFESGDLENLPWEVSGDAGWWVCSGESNSGFYSARAGWISDGQRSVLSIRRDCVAGEVSFYCKVSSEASFDCLRFSIDGVQQGRWSGEQDWTKVSVPVAAGARTFEWVYTKDGSDSRGSDTAWIDDIVFPVK